MILKQGKTIQCPQCKGETDDIGHCLDCGIIAIRLCPECGDFVWTDNDPEKNHGEEWCNSYDFFQNDFMTWEDIKEINNIK